MQAYDSSRFSVKLGRQSAPGTALFTGNQLLYIYGAPMTFPGKGPIPPFALPTDLMVITCSPPAGQDPWTNVSPATSDWRQYWKSTNLGKYLPGLSTPAVAMPNPATGGSDVFVFSGNSIVFRMNGGSPNSIDQISLASANRSELLSVGATAWCQYLLVGWWNKPANMLQWEAYDTTALPSPIPPDFVWTPAGETGGVPGMFQLPDGTLLSPDAFGEVASMDWFSLDGGHFYLVTSFMNGATGANILLTPMNVATPPGGGVPIGLPNAVWNWDTHTGDGQTTGQGAATYPTLLINLPDIGSNLVTVARDFAGRMTLCSVAADTHVASTIVIPNLANPFDPVNSPWRNSALLTWQSIDPQASSSDIPKGSQSPVTTCMPGPTYNYAYPEGKSVERQDVYQAFLYPDHDDGMINCLVQAFGMAEYEQDVVAGTLLPGLPYKNYTGVVAGIFDAPFPMPASNVLNNRSSLSGQDICVFNYGVTTANSSQHEADFSIGAGFSSQYVTTAGAGPAWNISFQKGSTRNSGGQTQTDLIQSSVTKTSIDSNFNFINTGSVQGFNVSYSGDNYRVLTVDGTSILPGCGNNCSMIATLSDGPAAISFIPYLATAGDLSSYTRESINAKAAALGLLQPGESDYVVDVIQANALQLPNNQNYLTYSQDWNNQSWSDYLQSVDKWQETGWFLDSSIYVGVSGGASVSVGVGDGSSITAYGFTIEQLQGVNISATHSTTTDTSTTVQMQLQNIILPEATDGADIYKMTVEIYFLPSNVRWMNELVQCVGDQLNLTDKNSQPWRIFFLVTSYASKDGTIVYPSS